MYRACQALQYVGEGLKAYSPYKHWPKGYRLGTATRAARLPSLAAIRQAHAHSRRPLPKPYLGGRESAGPMSTVRVVVLASSSAGNSTLVETGEGAFLVDAGLSARETERRLLLAGAHPRELRAIVLTHEHIDHVRGVRVLARRHGLEVLGTTGTLRAAMPAMGAHGARPMGLGDPFDVAGAAVELLPVPHDAADPAAVLVEASGRRVLVATDLGHVPQVLMDRARDLDALVLESNHDVRMLMEGPYPEVLKKRILSPWGHLSNEACARGLRALIGPRTRAVLLGHLSQHNNTEVLALSTVRGIVKGGVPDDLDIRATSPTRIEPIRL